MARTTLHRLLAATFCAAAAVACNALLGIEEQPTRAVDGGADAGGEADTVASRPELEPCARDVDCIAPNACYTPHCDTVLGACTYALCEAPGRTCAKGSCNPSTKTCSDPLPYGFLATRYSVPGATSGCGPTPQACVAAAFPFVFLGTRDDVIALRADDLTAEKPSKVTVTGVGMRPQQVIASGRRIWVLGAVLGQAPPYQLPIASIDVPSDPTAPELHAKTTIVSYPFPSAIGFPAPGGALFVAYNDTAQGMPTALVHGPIEDDTKLGLANAADAGPFDAGPPTLQGTITMFRVGGVPANAAIVASSGERLVLYRQPSAFNLIEGAGTGAGATRSGLALNAPLAPIGAPTFAQGPDGTVMIAAPITGDLPAPDCNCTSVSRLQYVLPNAVATTTDVNQLADYEVYTNPQVPAGACRQCTGDYFRPMTLATWLDRRTVLTAAPFSGAAPARMLTDVRLLGRDPAEANPKRRFQTKSTDSPKGDFALDRIALTASNGIGYLVVADGQGNDVSLSIVDPRCDAAE